MEIDLPPQAPFPRMMMNVARYDFTGEEITKEKINLVVKNTINILNLPGILEQFIQHIGYTEGLGPQFREYYLDILQKYFSYFKQLNFLGTELGYLQFMELRMLKFFDNFQNCISDKVGLLTNEPGYYEFTVDNFENCEKTLMLVKVVTKDNPICHRNLLEIDNKNKIVIITEPNFNKFNWKRFDEKLEGYKFFFENFQVYYSNIVGLPNHGGMCTLLAILKYYYPTPEFDFAFAREKFIEYLKWELENIKRGSLSFGKRTKLSVIDKDIKYLLKGI